MRRIIKNATELKNNYQFKLDKEWNDIITKIEEASEKSKSIYLNYVINEYNKKELERNNYKVKIHYDDVKYENSTKIEWE